MEELKKKRAQLKKSFTRLYNVISGPTANYNDIKVRIDEFDNTFKRYKDIQDQIDMLCASDNDIVKEDAYRNEIEDTYFAAKSIFSSLTQDNLENTVVEGAAAGTPSLSGDLTSLLQTMSTTLTSVVDLQSSSINNSNGNSNSNIRLPRIEIPDFDGNLSNWIRFRDLFNAMINNKTNLSDVEKLEYLQAKLKGEAASIIKHLTPTNSNYRVAWDLVNRKYDRPDQIRETYIRLLVTQPPVRDGTLSEIKGFYNNTIECYNALTTLYESVCSWDPLLLFLIKEKLDRETITLWYRQQKDNEGQTFEKLLEFLGNRVIELESLEISTQSSVKYIKSNKFVTMTAISQSCPVCRGDHFVFACRQFKDLDIEKRRDIVRKSGFCFNCLKEKHYSRDCKSSSCKTCGLKHNTLLHTNAKQSLGNAKQQNDNSRISPHITVNSSQQTAAHQTTLLPTAVILVRDKNSSLQPCRALMDTGAQSTLISEACVQRLKLRRSYDKTALCGVGSNNTSYTRGKVQIEIVTQNNSKTISVQTYCLSNLTQYIPSETIANQKPDYFQHLKLADPVYYKSNRIDIILGADVFPHCILGEKVSHPSGSPTALNTVFGWVIMGNVNRQPERSIVIAHLHVDLDKQLQRFWETEEFNVQTKYLTPDEENAELHFKEHVQRQSDGRYMVRLPFKTNSVQLGESKTAAMRRLESMERKFCRNIDLNVEFHKFMNEYIQLNHMEMVPTESEQAYYMPHHAVLKPSSTTTKLRVVFDASCKTSNHTSLNDHLLVGPTIQNDLYTILLNFRRYKIGFTADIEKMYRQVLIHPDDRSYQSILWRNSPKDLPTTYQLKTVTYGTAAAPFLATRTLMQVALDNQEEFPEESSEIMNSFYVDDYMSSAADVTTAISRCAALGSILSNSGFHLRKWSSNSRELVESIKPGDRAHTSEMIIDYSETVKTLGLLWNTSSDVFQYSVCFQRVSDLVTKRSVFSHISKVYDPIGWLSPVIIKMKIFMQKLWLKCVDWDQELSNDLKAEWSQLQHNVENIQDLQIPRWFNYNIGDSIELHGFADSSELAYAAAIYIRVIKLDGSITTSLVTAKTRVTPIRQITLPRLELCAAHLMVKLMVKVKNALKLQDVLTVGWTDSTVVLAWLSDHPRRWKTFIANRTSHIINIIPACHWRHITSKENPADMATRGISSSEIKNNSLWWQGPQILKGFTMDSVTNVSKLPTPRNVDLEERKVIAVTTVGPQTDVFKLFSSYNMLLRVTALMLRFAGNCKDKLQRKTGFITTTELQNAHRVLVRTSQQESYATEIRILASNKQLPAGNKLASLSPFIDNVGVLRVGGRIENACISYDQKHPYILHKNHTLTHLIIRHYHLKNLHAGKRQIHYLLSLKYWIPGISQIIKRTVYQCITCMRFRQKSYQQYMGNLPSCRLQPGSTFLYVGIDFAGPMLVKSWKGRGSKSYKCWLAVFVCLNTKAIHLEAVTDLSTQAFFASLRRFTSRRGTPLHIYTDNGTNFVGCNRELKELYDFLHTNYPFIQKEMSNEQIQWHFIPPSAPNFGGIWEAGVKSVKFHLKRVLGNSSTTYEELSTLLCQIECCLNSRPLCLKFEGDDDPLTPAHFLILRSLKSIPDENLIDVNINRLSRWQYIQRLLQQFWSKWSNEYLGQLQQRPKGHRKIQNLRIDDIVLIKDENLPPTQWLIGRIMITHPGKDNIVRVVSVQTSKGLLKRPISKVCPLFLDD